MTLDAFALQVLNGLASASTLFLVASGLSLIFGVTRVVNFAHGSMTMLGLYVAWSVTDRLGAGPLGWWGAVAIAVVSVAAFGALVEVLLLRRIYRAPELFQLLATFALVLVVRDAVLWLWGPEDLLGPKAPGLGGAVTLLGRAFPTYDLFLIAIGPLVLLALWALLSRTRFGLTIRAATQDREMVAALGIDQARLFTGVFALGAGLAGLGGALQMPREPANLGIDLVVIGEAFVVVVIGGLGSLPGAYVAAVLVGVTRALCHGLGTLHVGGLALPMSQFTLVAEFVLMALVLIVRPWGLFGRPPATQRSTAAPDPPWRPLGGPARLAVAAALVLLAGIPWLEPRFPYLPVFGIDVLIAVIFAASLHFVMGPAGLHSFGHAAYFGLGAYGTALAMRGLGLPMEAALLAAPLLALVGAALFGAVAVRLSGVYLAMLTLAFAQIVWSVVFQWDAVTGGSNGLVGLWPAEWLSDRGRFYALTLAVAVVAVYALRRMLFSPFGHAIRAARDAPLRAEASGMRLDALRWRAFVVAGALGGVAGALFAFAKGTISPEAIAVGRSVDGLVMVMLGGVQTLAGPVVGAVAFTGLQDVLMRGTDYWRAMLGGAMLALVLAFPQGLAGAGIALAARWRERGGRTAPEGAR